MGRLLEGLVDTSAAGVLLVLFIVLFALILMWVYRPFGRAGYEEASRVPLKDDPIK